VAHFPADALHREDLLAVADRALYRAKSSGRDMVVRGDAAALALEAALEQDPEALRKALDGANRAAIEALAAAVDARDPYTAGHSKRMADYSVQLARWLRWDDERVRVLRLACLFHDIGKIGVPDAILRKPGPLNDEEYREIQRHPEIGAKILAGAPFLPAGALATIRHHHERWDGRGYPDRLGGTDIPELARLAAVADGFDAMTSNRVYRLALQLDDVKRVLRTGAGIQWDATFAAAWLDFLASDEAATAQPTASLARPEAPAPA